jgi:hypothetical protein
MNKKELGKKEWAFSGGNIPVQSTGKEPDFVSQDKLAILNSTGQEASIKITLFFSDNEPVAEYELKIKQERVKKFRVNDLIDPQAIPLGVPYGALIQSNVPVVVQFTQQNTGQNKLAIMGTLAYFEDQK